MKTRLLSLNRIYKQLITLFFDELILLFSLWLAFTLRLGEPFHERLLSNLWLFISVPIVTTPLLIKLGLYRSVLQYIGIKVITTSFQAITISCLIVTFFMFFFREDDLPRSVIPIFWFIANTFIITSRFLLKGMIYSWDSYVNKRKQTIIYGAGSAGIQIAESLKKSIEYAPVAFLDDDPQKSGTIINFIRVSPFSKLKKVIKDNNAKLILIAIPSASQSKRKEILKKLSKFPLEK